MYILFTYENDISCSKDMFFRHIEMWKKDFKVVPVLTCKNELWYGLSNFDDMFILAYVGYCTDPEVLAPFQEAMLDEV